jgi:glycosyltransferase involved in cell wall biosynthesis
MNKRPKISVVTPSYNQAAFLERTITSVLDQGYPELEYIIIDGGSTDGSVDIIQRYASRLAYWVSEPDRGQSEAINKGLQRATGEWVAWQNSDDVYYPGAFYSLVREVRRSPQVDLITANIMLIDSDGQEIRDLHFVRPTHKALLAEGMVLSNQAAFWRRRVHRDIGWLDERMHFSFDYEWFLRLTKVCKAAHVNDIWGGFRLYETTKTVGLPEANRQERGLLMAGRSLDPWLVRVYQLRRLLLLLIAGDFSYVVRGLKRRLRANSGDFF